MYTICSAVHIKGNVAVYSGVKCRNILVDGENEIANVS